MRKIVVDLAYGSEDTEYHNDDELPHDPHGRGGRFVGNGGTHDASPHRRPSTLLRELIANPEYAEGDFLIELPGKLPVAAKSFFRHFNDATLEERSQLKAYWGTISSAAEDSGGTTWLNSGGRSRPSIPLNQAEWSALKVRYRIGSHYGVFGAHVLVFGELHTSPNKPMRIAIESIDYIYLQLTKTKASDH